MDRFNELTADFWNDLKDESMESLTGEKGVGVGAARLLPLVGFS